MTKYRLVTFEAAAGPRAGLVVDDALGPGATVALPKASKKVDWEVA